MQGIEFLKGLVQEIKRSQDPRFKAITDWCMQNAKILNSCEGDAEKQELHVALFTWMLLAEIRCLETGEMDPSVQRSATRTPANENDVLILIHRFYVDNEQKTLTITATAVDSITGAVVENMKLEPLIVAITPMFEENKDVS